MKFFFIVGEASGDIHASRLATAISLHNSQAIMEGWGGDLMEQQGVHILKHYRDLAFMGYVEVLLNLPTILKNFKLCKAQILAFQPDILILVDYPGFNLRIAKWAKKQGIKVVYYISPQVWAWKEGRVKLLKKYVDKLLCILPFEESYYKKHNWKVWYVGHPLVEHIDEYLSHKTQPRTHKHIVLMPGSRHQEIKKILPPMLKATQNFPNEKFIIAASPSLPLSLYNEYIKPFPNVTLHKGNSYDILYDAKIAVVKSGTSTLETALLRVPEVVCYKANAISFWIAKQLVKLPYISLVNLIINKKVVDELLQKDCNKEKITDAIHHLLLPITQEKLQHEYEHLHQILKLKTNVSQEAAKQIISLLHSS
ncbi:MAG: lipid-A-disaccharide synthase [Chitinophagaceae bacterium]